MVTKSTAKKSTTKKKPAVKHRASSAKTPTVPTYHTFKLSPDFPTFLRARLSRQTVYWTFLILCIIVAQLTIVAVYLNSTAVIDSMR